MKLKTLCAIQRTTNGKNPQRSFWGGDGYEDFGDFRESYLLFTNAYAEEWVEWLKKQDEMHKIVGMKYEIIPLQELF